MAREIFLGETSIYWRISGGIQEDLCNHKEESLLRRAEISQRSEVGFPSSEVWGEGHQFSHRERGIYPAGPCTNPAPLQKRPATVAKLSIGWFGHPVRVNSKVIKKIKGKEMFAGFHVGFRRSTPLDIRR